MTPNFSVTAPPAAAPHLTAGSINARLDRLPATRYMWSLVLVIALGGWFETYDAFFTAYVGPGLVKSGLFTTTTAAFFGFTGLGVFVAATFGGFFIGTFACTQLADRFGRRFVFTSSLIWYSGASLVMAFQHSAGSICLWRLISGIGMGVQLITIDSYVAELVPGYLRGRAFAMNRVIMWTAVPGVALLAWWLVPLSPLGIEGWRWVVIIGAAGALVVLFFIRAMVPESPRWLANRGQLEKADLIVRQLENRILAEYGRPLPTPGAAVEDTRKHTAAFSEIWTREYRARTIALMVFNFFQTIGVYGFASWVPTLLIEKGILVTKSLGYSFAIALAYPLAPLLGMAVLDKFERKWIIVVCALATCILGSLFAIQTVGAVLVVLGVMITLSNMGLAVSYHAYQVELFPTRVRARAVGFVYSLSRVSGAFSGFMVPYFLKNFGIPGVFALICGSMGIAMLAVGLFGPRTKGRELDAIAH